MLFVMLYTKSFCQVTRKVQRHSRVWPLMTKAYRCQCKKSSRKAQQTLFLLSFNLIILINKPEKEHCCSSKTQYYFQIISGKQSILTSKMAPENLLGRLQHLLYKRPCLPKHQSPYIYRSKPATSS